MILIETEMTNLYYSSSDEATWAVRKLLKGGADNKGADAIPSHYLRNASSVVKLVC